MKRPGLESHGSEFLREDDIQGGITRKMPGVMDHTLNVHVPECLKGERLFSIVNNLSPLHFIF